MLRSKKDKPLPDVLTGDPGYVMEVVREIWLRHYPVKDFRYLKKLGSAVQNLFKGQFPGYAACNTRYHDHGHTLSAVLAAARIIDGVNQTGRSLDPWCARLCIVATFFHDVGYLQDESDRQGTGAKYTLNHVSRSVAFVERHYADFDIAEHDVAQIGRMIRCTGFSYSADDIGFAEDDERIAGVVLGTADLLGQMADRQYLEKLLFLYYEFREAGISGYDTEFDILRKTADFYEAARARLDNDYGAVYKFAQKHFAKCYGLEENLYMESIQRNMDYLARIIDDASTNFRHKLRRGDWVDAEENVQVSL